MEVFAGLTCRLENERDLTKIKSHWITETMLMVWWTLNVLKIKWAEQKKLWFIIGNDSSNKIQSIIEKSIIFLMRIPILDIKPKYIVSSNSAVNFYGRRIQMTFKGKVWTAILLCSRLFWVVSFKWIQFFFMVFWNLLENQQNIFWSAML